MMKKTAPSMFFEAPKKDQKLLMYIAHEPLLRTSRILGISSLVLRNGKYEVSKWWRLYSFVLILFSWFTTGYALVCDFELIVHCSLDTFSKRPPWTDWVYYDTFRFAGTGVVFANLFIIQRHAEAWNFVFESEQMSRSTTRQNVVWAYIVVFTHIFFGLLTMFLQLYVTWATGKLRLAFEIEITELGLRSIIFWMEVLEFSACIIGLLKQFRTLNKQVSKLGSDIRSNNMYLRQSADVKKRISFLRRRLATLIRGCGVVNRAFSFQLFAHMTHLAVNTTFQCFFFLKSNEAELQLCALIIIVMGLIEILWIVVPCELIAEEVRITTVLIHDLLNDEEIDTVIETSLAQFSQQLSHSEVHFSALGLFTLEYAHLYSVLGAVTTYLVILYQFELSSAESSMLKRHCLTPGSH